MELTDLEMQRYKKHLQLQEMGLENQLKLKQAAVLVVGAGGLGSPVLLYLAAAGVGRITIVDGDVVTLSNLQRQVIHTTSRVGALKVESAKVMLHEINPQVEVVAIPENLTVENAESLIRAHQLTVDCTDNMETRLLINASCVRQQRAMVYGAVYEFEGQVAVFDAMRGPCLRCMLPKIPASDALPDPETHGLINTLPGIIGLLQANEVIKLITGIGDPLIGRLLFFDSRIPEMKIHHLSKNPDCIECVTRK